MVSDKQKNKDAHAHDVCADGNPHFHVAKLPASISGQTYKTANKQVLWGWKRNSGNHSRVVYFSGELNFQNNHACLKRGYFFYLHKAKREQIEALAKDFRSVLPEMEQYFQVGSVTTKSIGNGSYQLTVTFGTPTRQDVERVRRLRLRKPRRRVKGPNYPSPAKKLEASEILPADLYLGSGISYEAGLPTLCEVHDWFCLDNHKDASFTIGDTDKLAKWFRKSFTGTVKSFCQLHTQALTATIPDSYKAIKELHDAGLVKKIFSDNVDNVIARIGIPFDRTRGSGVFNERYPAKFKTNTLIVIGVAADRREIIKQAHAQNMKVIVVNPISRVSHGVQHLNYFAKGDVFYKMTADTFFKKLRPVSAYTKK